MDLYQGAVVMLFPKKVRFIIALSLLTMCSYAEAKSFSDNLRDRVTTIRSADDIATTIGWLTDQIITKPSNAVWAPKDADFYETAFCLPLIRFKEQLNVSDSDIEKTVAPQLSALTTAFAKAQPAQKEYMGLHQKRLRQLEVFQAQISPTDQSKSELTKKIELALNKVDQLLKTLNILDQAKRDAATDQDQVKLTIEEDLRKENKKLVEAIDSLEILRDHYYRNYLQIEAETNLIEEQHKNTLKEIEEEVTRINRERAKQESELAKMLLEKAKKKK